MSRPISENDLHAYIDNALDRVRAAEVHAYLENNDSVRDKFEGFAAQCERLRGALEPIAAEPIPPQLSVAHLTDRATRRRQWVGRNVAAACLLLMLGGGGGWLLHAMNAETAGIGALANEASYTYAVYGQDHARPVEIPSAQTPDLLAWMQEKLKHPVSVPDLKGSGFEFIGGRLVATQHGPAGLFIYDGIRGQRIAILFRPMKAKDRTARMAAYRDGEMTGFSWADDGMGYSLVGQLADDVLHPVADEARRQFLSS